MSLQKSLPFIYHQEIECQIERVDEQAVGFAQVQGQSIRIPFTWPGERIVARVYADRKTHWEADLLTILEPSSQRTQPKCTLFGACSGCQLQHMDYEAQLAWKQGQMEKLFAPLLETCSAAKLHPILGSPRVYGYRSKLTPHFNPKKAREQWPALGFLKVGRRSEIIDVEQCPIASDAINQALPQVRNEFQARAASLKRGGTLLLREGLGGVTTQSDEVVTEQVGEVTLEFPAGDFFQNNPFLLPKLVEYVASQAKQANAPYLLDAYCGSGLFALSLARYFTQAVGIEISARSILWARKNAERSGISNASFYVGSASELFAQVTGPGAQTVVIIDPPRKGCDELFLSQLRGFAPLKIIYISCNPATQARDLASLEDYELRDLQPFDLFPQTKHVECVAILNRKS